MIVFSNILSRLFHFLILNIILLKQLSNQNQAYIIKSITISTTTTLTSTLLYTPLLLIGNLQCILVGFSRNRKIQVFGGIRWQMCSKLHTLSSKLCF